MAPYAQLQLNPGAALDFGDVLVGQFADLPVQFQASNTGLDVNVSSITFPDPTFTQSGGPVAPFTVPQGTMVTLTFRFTPTAPGTIIGRYTQILSNNIGGPINDVFQGTGVASPPPEGILTLTPQTTNDFGNVKDGTTSGILNILAINNSPTDIIVSGAVFSGQVGPIFTSALNMAGTGYNVGDTFSVNTGDGNAVGVVDSTASGPGTGVATYHLTNNGTAYVPNINTATTTLTGGGAGFTIDISTVTLGEFFPAAGQPSYPFTLHANNADGPTIIPVEFEPDETGFVMDPTALEVYSNASNNPTFQTMQGTGVIILPAFTIPQLPQAVLIGIGEAMGSTILEVDTLDLDSEEPGSFTRVYDWGAPLKEKYLGRVIMRYEDESSTPFDVTCTANLTRQPTSVTDNLINEGGANDDLIHNLFFDLQTSDDLIQLVISRGADDGPLQITEMFHEIDVGGEYVPT